MRLVARVPATVANLGPGFDCFALALDLCNDVTIDTESEGGVIIEGEGAGELSENGSNLIVRAMVHLAREAGASLPSFSLVCVNRIPLERGLGSSGAAVVAGLILANALTNAELSPDRLLELAVDLEGHPDNVAAGLRGGITLAYRTSGGWRAESIAPAEGLGTAVIVPEARLSTTAARAALPREVSYEDAVFNAGRAALAILALTARPDLLGEALKDRLHQPYRLALVPAVAELFERLGADGFPVCVAGAGPSLLAFESVGRRLPDLGADWRVLRLDPRSHGADVEVI